MLFIKEQKFLSRIIFLKYILILFFILLPITGFSSSLEEYWKECEKCVNGQKTISGSIEMFIMDSGAKDFQIRSEEDYQKFIKVAYDRKYIKEPFFGAKGECSYRYNPVTSESYCIKHGSLERVKGYTYYSDARERQKTENHIFSLVGVGILIFAIFIDK